MVGSLPNIKRFDQVDGLRGIGCMLVIWHHVADDFAEIAGSGWWIQRVANDFNVGLIGVLAFFAISGYVIPSSVRGARADGVNQFLTRRFWRLYPPFWFALVATWLMDIPEFSTQRLAWNLTMVPSLGGATSAAGHFWTLEVELVFYLLVAALFLAIGKLGWKVMVPAFSVMGLWYLEWPMFPLEEHWKSIILYLAVMFWGACCRELMRFDFGRWVGAQRANLVRAIAIGLGCSTAGIWGQHVAGNPALSVLGGAHPSAQRGIGTGGAMDLFDLSVTRRRLLQRAADYYAVGSILSQRVAFAGLCVGDDRALFWHRRPSLQMDRAVQ